MRTELVFDRAFPGLNGKDGLIREHWAKRKKRFDTLMWEVLSQTSNRHEGRVRITYKRVSPRLMDWFENLPATGKLLIDAVVKCGVIKDDSPKIIPFSPKFEQEKGKAKTILIIEDLADDDKTS